MTDPTITRAAEVIQASGGWWDLGAASGLRSERIAHALANAGLLVNDEWVHVSCAGYTAPDMFEAFSAGIKWLADRVGIVDGEVDMPDEDQPGVEGQDHTEACGSWLTDYDDDSGRIDDDGHYRRPQFVTPEVTAVIDAADDTGEDAGLTWASHYQSICGCDRCRRLAAAVDALRAARGGS